MKNFKLLLLIVYLLILASCATVMRKSDSMKEMKALFLPIEQYYVAVEASITPINKAARLVRTKHYGKAHEVLNQMLKKKDNLDGVYYFKGYVFLLEKKYDFAKFMYKKVERREEYASAIDNNLGVIALLENDFDTAYFYFTKVLAKYPYYFPALVNRGMIYLHHGLYKSADEDLETALVMRPDDKNIQMARGVALRGLGSFGGAEKIFLKLSGDPDGLYNLGLVYYEDMEDWKRARDVFHRYLSLGLPLKRGNMANIYLKRAREKLAK